MKKKIKTGARIGGGPEPGFKWRVDYLTVAQEEAEKFLTDDQLEHVIDQIRSLATEED